MTPLTQTRRTAPLAGDGNGNPSPRAVPTPSRATPELLGAPKGERDTCGRASSDPLGRLSIQTRASASSLPAAREAGHGSGAANPVEAGPAAREDV